MNDCLGELGSQFWLLGPRVRGLEDFGLFAPVHGTRRDCRAVCTEHAFLFERDLPRAVTLCLFRVRGTAAVVQ